MRPRLVDLLPKKEPPIFLPDQVPARTRSEKKAAEATAEMCSEALFGGDFPPSPSLSEFLSPRKPASVGGRGEQVGRIWGA